MIRKLNIIEGVGWELTTDKHFPTGYYDKEEDVMLTRQQVLAKKDTKNKEYFNVVSIVEVENED